MSLGGGNKKTEFVVCPRCQGTGYLDSAVCPDCHGAGVGLILDETIFFWGKSLEPSDIIFDNLINKIKIIFNALLTIIGLSGLILLGYYGYQDNFATLFSLDYWITPSNEKLYFWITLLVDLYLYYRLSDLSNPKYQVALRIFKKDKASSLSGLSWLDIWRLKKNQVRDVSPAFTEEAHKAIQASRELAKHFGHNEILRIHLFSILAQFNKSGIILARLGINFEAFKQKLSRYLGKNILPRVGEPKLTAELYKTLLLAYAEAYWSNNKKVELPEIVAALSEPNMTITKNDKDDVLEILLDLGYDYQKLKNVVAWIRIQEQMRAGLQRFRGRARYKPKSGMDRAMTAVATPLLDQFSEDLTVQAINGYLFPCIGRDDEIEKIFRIMEGSREGVLLLGHQGVGRTSIIHGLAQRMVMEDVPEVLQDKRLVSLDIARLLAGCGAAQAEQRLLLITDEIMRSRNIILAVENLHNLTGISAGAESSLDLSEVFAQIVSRHLFYVIATSSPNDYARAIEGRGLDAQLQIVRVEELEINEAIQVMEAKSGPIEYQNQVYFSYEAIEKAAVLSSRYIHDRYLPDKALEIMEQSAIKVRNTRGEKQLISGNDVAEIVSNITKIPVTAVSEQETEKLLNLEARIHERMIGQDEAVSMVASSLRRARAELREGKRPIASFLFLGPTGVGKTELTKSVAEIYFGREDSMLRFDMSEYQEVDSLKRLLGFGTTPGQLTEAVRKNPFSLLLFDEVEKAHKDILNVFLQVMDDGRLTDAQGRTIDFTNAIIIMTSNAGAQYIQDEINKGTAIEHIKTYLLNEELKKYYRPEFLNRFDGVIVFKPLTLVDVVKIAKILMRKIAARLEEKGIIFKVTDEAIAELAELGYDPKFGARPLRRVVQERIDDVLADKILRGEVVRRDEIILEPGGNIKINKAEVL